MFGWLRRYLPAWASEIVCVCWYACLLLLVLMFWEQVNHGFSYLAL